MDYAAVTLKKNHLLYYVYNSSFHVNKVTAKQSIIAVNISTTILLLLKMIHDSADTRTLTQSAPHYQHFTPLKSTTWESLESHLHFSSFFLLYQHRCFFFLRKSMRVYVWRRARYYVTQLMCENRHGLHRTDVMSVCSKKASIN